ncbi:MAG: serine hydrolase [Leptolyngbya sp. DLM2.Bin27]|nr:MAG: serine hydrolase [Leptolyngbya sp. DLM2.Bin27]
MAQYNDSHNPFSASSDRPNDKSPWSESAPDPSGAAGPDGLQLPGESGTAAWGGDGAQRPSPLARRRNQWRQYQQLTPDFGVVTPDDAEPVVRPVARNASLPAFGRAPESPPAPRPPAAHPTAARPTPPRPTPPRPASPPSAPASWAPSLERQPGQPPPSRPAQPGTVPLQMHPHSIQGEAVPLGSGGQTRALPPNVTPLRPRPRRPRDLGKAGLAGAAGAAGAPRAGAVSGPAESGPPPRRSRAATTRKKLANPPLPLLYLIRLVILGVGVAAIAGTLLSVLSPSNIASSRDGDGSVSRPAEVPGSGGVLAQGAAATAITDLRLTSEITRLKGELEQLATLTPGLTPVAFAIDLDSGQYVDLGGAEPVAAASTIKVPILMAFLQQVDAGNMALNQSLALREEHLAGGSGTMRGEAVGTEYTALEVATQMIVISDNTATNMMIAALGGIEALNQTFVAWGLEHTLLRNPLPDLEGTNITSAKDLALIMALIDQGGLLSTRSRDRLFSIMQRTQNDSLIPSGIRDRSLTANKTGDIGGMLGDVALVDVPNGKRYSLAVLVQRPNNDGRASELIRRMTETVHAEMAQPLAPVGSPDARAPLSPPGEFENPAQEDGGNLDGPAPANANPPDRAPDRDQVPPG